MKIKDPLVLGAIAGAIANLAKLLGNEFGMKTLKISQASYPEMAAGLFMTKKERRKPVALVVGTLADLTIGGIMGVPLVYILRYTGRDFAPIKGIGYGLFAWVLLYGALGRFLGTKSSIFPLSSTTSLSAYINHSIYGAIAAVLTAKLGDPSLFPEPGGKKTNINYAANEQ
ncbi:MAG: hypothetical protein GXZ07_01055 [Firmicutes bacterium]|jgi:hypothetical protein|nr:hypothetical protein [Bacillota bacterium]